MTKIEQHLEKLTDSLIEADKLYQSPWPDRDVLGPDASRPHQTAAIDAVAAVTEFLRAAAPVAPRGILMELLAALSDLAGGSSPRLLERPAKRRGAPGKPASEELQMAKLASVADHLIGKGMPVKQSVRMAASVDGVSHRTLANYRKKIRRRPREAQDLYDSCRRQWREHEDDEDTPSSSSASDSLPVWPIKERRTVRKKRVP